MTALTFEEFQANSENTRAVRKTLGAVLALAPETADPVVSLTDTTGLKVNALPVGYFPVGLLTPDGISFEREVDTETVDALGHFSPVREDITGGARRLTFNAYEVQNRHLIEVAEGLDLSTVAPDAASGEVTFDVPDVPNQVFYRAVVIGYDGSVTAPYLEGKFFPRVSVTSFPSDTWNKADARTMEIGLTAYADEDLGFIERRFIGGAGFKANSTALGWGAGA